METETPMASAQEGINPSHPEEEKSNEVGRPPAALGRASHRVPLAVAMPLVAVVFAVADLAVSSQRPSFLTTLATIGLGVGLGGLSGALLDLARFGISRLPHRFLLLWPATGLSLGALIADELNAFDKLGTRDHRLAVYTLVAAAAAGLGIGLVAAFLQPGGHRNRSSIAEAWRRPWQHAAGAVLLVAAMGATYVDRTAYVGLYDVVHSALRVIAVYLAGCAVVLASHGHWRLGRRQGVALLFAASALFAVPWLFLTDSSSRSIRLMDNEPYPSMLLGLARDLTDFDLDGYSSLLGGGDCAPWNRRINPGRSEIPANGKDDNCWGGDLAAAPVYDLSVEKLPMPAEPSPVDVVLITLDSTRADRLGAYGYKRPITPNLDKLASRGVVFENAFSAGPWTSVAVPSLLRGVFPRRMQWTAFLETDQYRLLEVPYTAEQLGKDKPHLHFLLPAYEPRRSVAWWLSQRGMRTMAVVDDGYSQMLSAKVGTRNGFAKFLVTNANASRRQGDAATAKLAIDLLKRTARKGSKPFFFWVHFFGPHSGSYNPPKEKRRYEKLDGNLYDDRLANTDEQVGLLIDAIDEAAQQRPIAIVLSADHGEGLHGSKSWHGSSLEDELLRVPLIVAAPSLTPRRVAATVGSVDVMPTILSLTGCPVPSGLDGIDLLPLARGETQPQPRRLIADNWRMDSRGRVRTDQTAAFDGQAKVILNRRTQVVSYESQAPTTQSAEGLELLDSTTKLEAMLRDYVETSPDLESRVTP